MRVPRPALARLAARTLALLAGSALVACGGRAAPAATPAPRDVRAELRRGIDSLLDDPQFANAQWGVLIVRPGTGDTLYARNAGKLFMPASNQKILTGTTALALLGPEYRWRTTFAARGPVRNGVLDGDLVVIGRGDPTLSDHALGDAMQPLRDVADSLRARGITRITGRVVSGGDAFPGAPWGYGWAWDDMTEPYSAGVDELLFNEGFSRVIVRAGARAGDAATARTAPAASWPSVRLAVRTVAAPVPAGDSAARREPLRATPDTASGGWTITGELAVGDSAVLALADQDPTTAYLAAVTEALAARGIAVDRRAVAAPASARLDTLHVMQSPTLRAALTWMQKPSQNQIAEAVFRTLGLERAGVGSPDSARRVVERQLRTWGIDPDRDVAVRDGSGLSRHDYVTPRAIVRALDGARRDSAFRAFYDALPIAGVDGTISNRMKGTPAQGNVHAKTGFVDKARSLSGYVTTADGELVIFSALCNNFTVPLRAVERVQDTLAVRLATLRLGAPR